MILLAAVWVAGNAITIGIELGAVAGFTGADRRFACGSSIIAVRKILALLDRGGIGSASFDCGCPLVLSSICPFLVGGRLRSIWRNCINGLGNPLLESLRTERRPAIAPDESKDHCCNEDLHCAHASCFRTAGLWKGKGLVPQGSELCLELGKIRKSERGSDPCGPDLIHLLRKGGR